MRLTLRTLLAYRDGVLDPKDAATLEAKILDSSTAQRISKRIADEMQNRRLAPIPVDAREFGFEANLVAEFLDDTIPMETLPQMERKCLENNTLLSEIGSCHQILSRALSIPAPVAASLRQRIHELPNQVPSKSFDLHGNIRRFDRLATPSMADTLPGAKVVRKPSVELRGTGIELNDGLGRQVPEYLIGRDHGWLKNASLGLLLTSALVVVGAIAIGPFDRVRDLLKRSNATSIASAEPKNTAANASEPIANRSPSTSPIPAVPPRKTAESETTSEPILEPDGEQPIIAESASAPPPPVSTAVPSGPEKPVAQSVPIVNSSPLVPSAATPSAATLSASAKNRMQWLPDTKVSSESIVLKRVASPSDGEVFWTRMSPGEYVNLGDRMVVPPTQRTEMRVDPGIRLLCAGDNDIEVVKQIDAPKIALYSGRILIFATPDARELAIDCNGLELSVSFASTDGSCAVEVQNVWSPLTDEMAKKGTVITRSHVRCIGVEGELKFSSKHQSGAIEKGALGVGQFLDWHEGVPSPMQELAEAPWWFRTSISRAIDQPAAIDLQRALVGGTAGQIEVELADLTNHRRGETAALATRTRLMLGHYDRLFESDGILNRKGLHSHWQSILTQIPQSLARSEHREAWARDLQRAVPTRFLTIVSALVPPSVDQLQSGADKILVEGLSSPHLDERVISYNQLNFITGKSLGYQPDKSQLEAIAQWRKLLSKNEIRYAPNKP